VKDESRARTSSEAALTGEASYSFAPLTETARSPYPPRQPIVESLIDRGEIAVLAATPGTGKTPFLTQLLSCVATGLPFLSLPTEQGGVVLVDAESQPANLFRLMRQQWDMLGDIEPFVSDYFHLFVRGLHADPNSRELERIMKLSAADKWRWLSRVADLTKPTLVAIDTLLTFSPFASRDEERTRHAFANLADLRHLDSRPAILSTVHLRKRDRRARVPSLLEDPFGWVEEILGSVVWSASADVRLGLERTEEGLVVLGGFRRGSGQIGPYIIEPQYEGTDESAEPAIWVRSSANGLALQALTKGQREYLGRMQVGVGYRWTELRHTTGASRSGLQRFLERADPTGLVEHVGDMYFRRG
jgi:hypothetical protein